MNIAKVNSSLVAPSNMYCFPYRFSILRHSVIFGAITLKEDDLSSHFRLHRHYQGPLLRRCGCPEVATGDGNRLQSPALASSLSRRTSNNEISTIGLSRILRHVAIVSSNRLTLHRRAAPPQHFHHTTRRTLSS